MQEKVSNIFNLRYVFNEDKNIFMLENGVVFTRQEFNSGKATHEQMQERLEAGLTYDYEKFKYSKVTIDARRAYHRGTTWHHSPAIR
mgnify:CR=1 FL=1